MIRDSMFETPTARKVLERVVSSPVELPEQVRNSFLEQLYHNGKLIFAGISKEEIEKIVGGMEYGKGDLIKRVNEELTPNMVQASADIQNLPDGAIWVLTKYAYLQDGSERIERALKRNRSEHFNHLHYRRNLMAVARRAREEGWKNVNTDRLDQLLRGGRPFEKFVREGKIWLYGLHKTAVIERPLRQKAPVGYEWLIGKSPVRITYDRAFNALQMLTAHIRDDYDFDIEVLTKEYPDPIRGRVESKSKTESGQWYPRIKGIVTDNVREEERYVLAFFFEAVDGCADSAFMEDLHRQYKYGLCFPCCHSLALYLKRLLVPEEGKPKMAMNVVALPTEEMAKEAYKFVEQGFVLDENTGRHIASGFLFSKLYGLFLLRNKGRYDELVWHFRREPFERYMLQRK